MTVNFRTFFSFLVIIIISALNCSIGNAIAIDLPIVNPDEGIYIIRPKCARDKVLSVYKGSTEWGSNVIIDERNSKGSEWILKKVGDSYYTITALHSYLSLDVEGAKSGNAINISTWEYHGGNQNKFRFHKNNDGYYVIRACVPGDYVIDVAFAQSQAGTNVWSYEYNTSDAQLWILEKISDLSQVMNPKGNVELVESTSAGTLRVKGTASDIDTRNGSIRLHVYVGGGAGSGAPNYEIRTDGNTKIFDDTRKVERTGRQKVHIYALNDYGGGENVEIWNGFVDIKADWQWPVDNLYVTQKFANWYEPKAREGRPYHCGIDIKNSKDNRNPPIYAAATGTIKYRDKTSENGNHVIIRHNLNGRVVYTLYSHLDNFNGCPDVGQTVYKGQQIGTMGLTGNTTGLHLHFAIFEGESNDPVGYAASRGTGNLLSLEHKGKIFYDPNYVIENGRLP